MYLLTLAQNCIVQNEAFCLITGGFASNFVDFSVSLKFQIQIGTLHYCNRIM